MTLICARCNSPMEIIKPKHGIKHENYTASSLANTSVNTPITFYATTTEIPFEGERYNEEVPLIIKEFKCPNCGYRKTDFIED